MTMWAMFAGAATLAMASVLSACGGDHADPREAEVLGETSQAVRRLAQARAVCSAADGGVPEAGVAPLADAGAGTADAGAASAAKPGKSPLATPKDPSLASYASAGGKVVPQFDVADGVGTKKRPKVELPSRADGEIVLGDSVAQLTVRARLRGAGTAPAALGGDGVLVYPDAFGSGSDVLVRATPEGFEDFVTLPVGTSRSSLVYDLTLGSGVAGLRLVASTLEFLDGSGTPRLRIRAPEIADAACTVHAASLTVEGCAVDTNPAAPWGRPVTAPGKSTCAVRLSWNPSQLTLPALVDPSWASTGWMSGLRGGHEAVLLGNGNVLVAGNSNGGAQGASAELYQTSGVGAGTWAAAESMKHDRYWHQLTRLQDGRVLASGGISLAGVTRNSAELYDPSTGHWTLTGSMAYARARHASALLAAETIVPGGTAPVIVAGSDAASYYGPPPERFNPAGAGTWSVPPGHGTSDAMRVSLTRLPSGKLLEAGGAYAYYDDWTGTLVRYSLIDAYTYDPALNSWTLLPAAGRLKQARYGHAATVVGGKVLLAGGMSGSWATASAELWDPITQTSTLTGSMVAARGQPVMVLDNVGAPVIHESGWYSNGATERFNGGAWSSWAALPGSGWFYYARTVRLPNGEVLSAGLNDTTTFNPVAVRRLGLACPTPLPPTQPCWSAPVCDSGTYVPPVPLTNGCCLDGSPRPSGTACNDTNSCTGPDACDGNGTCVPGPQLPKGTVCSSMLCRQDATCDDNATCVPGALLPAGASCADYLACNGMEVCSSTGVCQAGTPLPNGSPCSTGAGCRTQDQCNAGMCIAGTPLLADDGNSCTTETCNGGVTSTFNPVDLNTCSAIPNLPADTPNRGMDGSFDFLFTGASAVQQGVVAGTIDKSRLAVIRGRVLGTNGSSPAPGVIVSVLSHPEYGTTSTRTDGYWDLAVNGGDTFTFQFEAADMLTVQRTVKTKVHDWTVLDDVVQTAPRRRPNTFTPGAPSFQVVEGLLTPSDGDPSRQARIYFAPNTLVKDKVGNVRTDLTGKALRVDVTEYTTDANGLRRMPGDLPPTSGYTYAVDVSLHDPTCLTESPPCTETTLPEVVDPVFTTPASLWVENFVNATSGGVPTGSYDRARALWIAEPNGTLVDTRPNQQSGLPSDPTELAWATNAINPPPPVVLPPNRYMRVPLAHLSSWDANWGIAPPPDPKEPVDPKAETVPDCVTKKEGSIIGCETQTLGEEIPIAGTSLRLRYESSRTPGYSSKIRFAIAGSSEPTVGTNFIKAIIEVTVAGRRHTFYRGTPRANETFTFAWDGLDAYGRKVLGTQRARIRVGYEYGAVDLPATGAFGLLRGPSMMAIGDRLARTFTYWRESEALVSRFDAKEVWGLGGWSISGVDRLDVGEALAVEEGDGERRPVGQGRVDVLHSYPSTSYVDAVQTGDGTMYFSFYQGAGGILKRAPDGTVTPFVGPGGVLTQTVHPGSMALDRDGNIVFIEDRYVWKLTLGATPSLVRIAGKLNDPLPSPNCGGDCGDGPDALLARFGKLNSIATGPDGSVFVSDTLLDPTVRRITPEGRIETWYVAVAQNRATRLSVLANGSVVTRLYSPQLVLRLGPDGTVSSVLGKRADGVNDKTVQDDVCAAASQYDYPMIALEDGGLLVGCRNAIVKWSAGKVTKLLGTGVPGSPRAGAPLQVFVNPVDNMKLTPTRDLVFTDWETVRRVTLRNIARAGALGIEVPSADGAFVDVFDQNSGRHIQKRHAMTGAMAMSFGDTSEGLFDNVVDANGNQLVAVRSGDLITLRALPGGQETVLTLAPSGWLASVSDPEQRAAGKATLVTHAPNGLLSAFTDALGNVHHFEYDPHGRLLVDRDARPASRGQRLDRQDQPQGFDVTLTSAEGRATTHGVRFDGVQAAESGVASLASAEEYRFTQRGALVSKSYRRVDGTTWSKSPDGSVVDGTALLPDPRWGMTSPFTSSVVTTTGSLSQTRTLTRTATLGIVGDPFSLTSAVFTSAVTAAGGGTRSSTSTFTQGSPATWVTLSAQNRQVKAFLDSQERVTRVEVGVAPFVIAPVEYGYDARGRLSTVTQGARTWRTDYDDLDGGWPSTVTAPGGIVTSFLRDDNGRPTSITLPGGRVVGFGYDHAGNLTSVTPPGRPAHGFTFDANNRLASYVPPDGFPAIATKDTLYSRDFDGLVTSTNAASFTMSTAFDTLARPGVTSGNVPRSVAYDAQGRVSSIGAGAVTLTNNAFQGSLVTEERLGGVVAAGSGILTRTFDNFFQVASWNVSGPGTSPASGITLDYDADGFPVGARTPGTTEVLHLSRHAHTGLVTHSQPTTASQGAVWDDTNYSIYGELETYAVSRTVQPAPYSLALERDAAGRIWKKTETVLGTTTVFEYTYDAAGRLDSEKKDGVANSWSFDSNGNRGGWTVDDQDRLTERVSGGVTTSYGYTSNGELATKTAGGATTQYSYDTAGNLRGVTLPNNTVITYVVDGLNRRVGKKVNGVLKQVFVYDGPRVLAELDGSGNVISRFVYLTHSHSPDLAVTNAGAAFRFVKDHLGSVRMVLNQSTGAVVQRLDYDAWGNTTVVSDTAAPALPFQPFGFAGGLWDRDTNLVRFGARDYDPATGRWTTKDGSRFGGGLNFYVYAENDPINLLDPEGESALLAVAVAGGGAAGGATLGGMAANPIVPLAGINLGIAYVLWQQATALSNEWDTDALLGRGQFASPALEARGRGERGQAGKSSGTANPDKHLRWDAKKGVWYYIHNQTGKRIDKPKGYRPPPQGLPPLGHRDEEDDDACD